MGQVSNLGASHGQVSNLAASHGQVSKLAASHSISNLPSGGGGRHTRGRTWDGQTRSKSSTNLVSNVPASQATNGPQIRRTSSQEYLKQTNIVNKIEPPPQRGQWVQPDSSQSSLSSTNSNQARYEAKHKDSVQDAWQQSGHQQQQSTGGQGSAQFQYLLQQQQANGKIVQQQRLQEQKQISYDMTQQSKAKHQEKVGF